MMRSIVLLLAIFYGLAVYGQRRPFIDPANLDTTIRPGNDFYSYANGGWLAAHTIPANEPGWGEGRILALNNFKKVRSILESAAARADTDAVSLLIGAFYESGMDTDRINRLGRAPLKAELAAINAIRDPDGLLKLIAKEHTEGLHTVFEFYTRQDQKNNKKMIACLEQGGLGLPDRSYYLTKAGVRTKFGQAYIDYIAHIAGMSHSHALMVWHIETLLATVSQSAEEQRDVAANYHKFAVAKLPVGIKWSLLFAALNCHTDSVVLLQPQFFTSLGKLLRTVPLPFWKHYLRFHLIDNRSDFLDMRTRQAAFNFRGKLLQGLSAPQERWEEISAKTDELLGDALGYLYIRRYFSPLSKKRMDSLVAGIRASFASHIRSLEWMSPQTKVMALDKLNAVMSKVGYPAQWDNYKGLVLLRGNYYKNAVACQVYGYRKMLRELTLPPDLSRWGMTPPTVNAYYDFSKNEIVFPAGILQYPYFDADADDAFNYGAIGVVIAHELTHGFDDQGSQFDAQGNLHPWWTPEDEAAFRQKTKEMIRIYSESTILDSLHINGQLTLGENIADFGGVAIAFDAFRQTAQYKENRRIDAFTPAQRFFLSYAQTRRRKARPEYIRGFIKTNEHAPSELRVNIPLANFTPFYEAFDLKPADKLYKPPARRLYIW